MKKIFITLISITLSALVSYSQMAGKLFQGTLKHGSTANSVIAVIKSSASFSGKFSNVQFTFQIPNTVSPQPVVKIKTNPLNTYIPTASYVTQVRNEGGFYNYLFAAVPTASPTYNFTAATEIDALEVEGIGMNGTNVTMRLASLANGGSTGQLNFYIEVSGNDNTNDAAMFYGTGASNGGSYSAYSYVPLTNVVLPLRMLNFNVTKSNDNVVLNWAIQNESPANSYFEIERSINGTSFIKIGELAVLNSTTSNTYQYTDTKLSTIKNNGLLYYRLKQVDKDGKSSYSEIKKISLGDNDFSFGIVTNPIKGSELKINLQSPNNSKGTLRVFDLNGKQVYQSNISWSLGYSEHVIQLPVLSPGSYIASLSSGTEQYQAKFVK